MRGLDANAGSNSKLSKPVQDLIRMIFDVDSMKKTMLEFEVRLADMPLSAQLFHVSNTRSSPLIFPNTDSSKTTKMSCQFVYHAQ